jgi:hypothetical protein
MRILIKKLMDFSLARGLSQLQVGAGSACLMSTMLFLTRARKQIVVPAVKIRFSFPYAVLPIKSAGLPNAA